MEPCPIIQKYARRRTLCDLNSDMGNWNWCTKRNAPWRIAENIWQSFLHKWYGLDDQSTSLSADPKALSLEHLSERSIDPFAMHSIFVRKSYEIMFDTIWAQAVGMEGLSGAIVTGQPGTGKSLFSYYLLIQLLKRKQVVLFSPDGKTVYLFYHGEVHTIGMEVLAAQGLDVSLPSPKSRSKVFIWTLFDMRDLKEPDRFLVTYPSFPVQTASPDPSRYKSWAKVTNPLITGLPLWSREELAQGLKFQARYDSLLRHLQMAYRSSPTDMSSLIVFPGAKEILEERYSNNGSSSSSPEDAVSDLLDAAVERFGFSARDVFSAVFNFSSVTIRHQKAFDMKAEDLQSAVSALSKNCSCTNEPHRILAVTPIYHKPFENVRWNVDFKSNWIAKNVMKKLVQAEDEKIIEQIRLFRNIPEARGMVGRLLEPLAHRYLANVTNGFWSLIPMVSNDDTEAPNFRLAQGSSVTNHVGFSKAKRKIIMLYSTEALSECFEHMGYYIPTDPNFPLFDSFTIELNLEEHYANLWILQMTTSRLHRGSTKGYQNIRDIVGVIKEKMQALESNSRTRKRRRISPIVNVIYLLVVPKEESHPHNLTWNWQFPSGWSENRQKNDHCGDVYCLEVPLTVHQP